MQRSVGTWGLTGLDRLLCFMIVQELQNTIIFVTRHVFQDKALMDILNRFNRELKPMQGILRKCFLPLNVAEQLPVYTHDHAPPI